MGDFGAAGTAVRSTTMERLWRLLGSRVEDRRRYSDAARNKWVVIGPSPVPQPKRRAESADVRG
jgi:hypothetical protein